MQNLIFEPSSKTGGTSESESRAFLKISHHGILLRLSGSGYTGRTPHHKRRIHNPIQEEIQ
jgi:hypothetical protein